MREGHKLQSIVLVLLNTSTTRHRCRNAGAM